METAVLELERKRITLENEKKASEEGKKAAKAMEALNVSSSSSTTPRTEDLNLIVGDTFLATTEPADGRFPSLGVRGQRQRRL